ncbi:hypothetical protein BDW59DRAFT_156843 [Aspergillus cavernicola]|uniref:Arrestin-like N-terminal domain-containing protein n=1 Tax=Aspergillus cavernicola TaxID=176166 RepID=A0ABR4J0J7_9EURO
MLSQVKHLFNPRMDVRIRLRDPPVYTNEDEVSGHVILATAAQVDISTITIKLSGSATSRLDSGLTETHQLFKTNEQIFPPSKCATSFTSRAATVSPGEHAFAFTIKFPQASQCYKASFTSLPGKHTSKPHLLRRLPPSTGDRTTPEEIKYSLETIVRQDGIICGTHRAIREIHLQCLSTISLPLSGQHGLTAEKTITSTADPSSSTCINARLSNGPFLQLGHPIPLEVEITNSTSDITEYPISLHDFQSMLLETTTVQARGETTPPHTRSVLVQTMSNLRNQTPILSSNGDRTSLVLDATLWSRHCVPLYLTPSFETCNVSRSYKLEIRLGIGFGDIMRIVEFQFPVYIVVLSLGVDDEWPAPDYCEKEVFGKEVDIA